MFFDLVVNGDIMLSSDESLGTLITRAEGEFLGCGGDVYIVDWFGKVVYYSSNEERKMCWYCP